MKPIHVIWLWKSIFFLGAHILQSIDLCVYWFKLTTLIKMLICIPIIFSFHYRYVNTLHPGENCNVTHKVVHFTLHLPWQILWVEAQFRLSNLWMSSSHRPCWSNVYLLYTRPICSRKQVSAPNCRNLTGLSNGLTSFLPLWM